MNERIKELAEQAGWMMGDEVEGFNIRLEKFAELIIRQAHEIIVVGGVDDVDDVDDVLKYFGVE